MTSIVFDGTPDIELTNCIAAARQWAKAAGYQLTNGTVDIHEEGMTLTVNMRKGDS